MKVFISWSGHRSRAVAELLNDWIKCVLQATRPWMSSRDIERGSLWFGEIADQLKDTAVGIVCLTQANKHEPWILFESGALAKGLSTNRVCTFLIDLLPKDIEDPLAQFNHTMPHRDGLWSLVRTLNSSLGTNVLDERILQQVFDTYWPQFEERFRDAIKKNEDSEKSAPRPKEDILGEILQTTRTMGSRLAKLEQLNEMAMMENHHLRRRYVRDEGEGLSRLRQMIEAERSPEAIMDFCKRHEIPSEIFEREYARYRVRSTAEKGG